MISVLQNFDFWGTFGQKNLSCWYELVRQADVNKWFFVQVGRLNLNNLSLADEVALKSIQNTPPENLLILAEYLPDERAFNEIIALSDIIFTAISFIPFLFLSSESNI